MFWATENKGDGQEKGPEHQETPKIQTLWALCKMQGKCYVFIAAIPWIALLHIMGDHCRGEDTDTGLVQHSHSPGVGFGGVAVIARWKCA